MLGIFDLNIAITKAKQVGLDIIQVGNIDNIPTCKMLSYSKYKYKLTKKSKQGKNKKTKTKEIKLRPNTDINDINIKLKATELAINNGHKVKISLILRGRETIYENEAKTVLEKFRDKALYFSKTENSIKKEGRTLSILITQKNE